MLSASYFLSSHIKEWGRHLVALDLNIKKINPSDFNYTIND